MSVAPFDVKLAEGRVGESLIASFLRSRGVNILPVYEIEQPNGKGPRVFASDNRQLVAPDMFAFASGGRCMWVEAKHKDAFTWHRNSQKWTTGIDRYCYEDYLELRRKSGINVYLMFLHRGGQAKDSPPSSPSGLFMGELDYLSRHVNHRHANFGKSGGVFWAIDTLKKLATLDEVYKAAGISRN